MANFTNVINRGHIVLLLILSQGPLRALALPPTAVDVRSYSRQCKIEVLQKLGWNVQTSADPADTSSGPTLNTAKCTDSVSTPLLKLPISASPLLQEGRLNQAFYSAAFNCTYQQVYSQALQRATRALKSDHLYWFTPNFISDNLVEGGLTSHWEKDSCGAGLCLTPKAHGNAAAINSLYRSFYLSDCGLGLQMAEYAAAKELVGDALFDQIFSSDEIQIGDWPAVQNSRSFTHGPSARNILPRQGLDYAFSGFQSFVGVSGLINEVNGEASLDDTANRNENFIIVKTSQAADTAWLHRGGLQGYTDLMKQIWEFSQNVPADELLALENMARQDRLDGATDLQIQRNLPSNTQELFVSDNAVPLAKMMSDPFLRDTMLYVHPVGERSLAWHILRLARINHRTPYGLIFYNDSAHAEVMDRWLKAQLDRCESQ